MLAAGILGFWGGRRAPQHFSGRGGYGAGRQILAPPLSTTTPLPCPRALLVGVKLATIAAVGALLWLLPLGLLQSQPGLGAARSTINGLVLPKPALLTIGGACIVCPMYTRRRGHLWLADTHPMIDGLAWVKPATPGPLVMVVAFVARLWGLWQAGIRAQRQLIRRGGGSISDLVLLFYRLLFLFLAGGPLVESTWGT